MSIPTALIERLQSVDTSGFTDAKLHEACDQIAQSFLSEKCSEEYEQIDQTLIRAVGAILIRAASHNLEPSELQTALDSGGNLQSRLVEAVLNAYSTHVATLTEGPLRTIGWRYPKLVDIDWRLSGVMESESETRIKEPLAEITFTSLACDTTKTDDFTFQCNKQQLKDLQWKVKEAYNLLNKMASSAK